eukprot:scaffold98375_cov53-Cyclotella_meneghiniana.AAC.2
MADNSKTNYYKITPAQPLTLQKQPVHTTHHDSPLLLEAKLIETISSIRQLISTNAQLDEILKQDADDELLQALTENDALIARKIEECNTMKRQLSEMGSEKLNSNLDVPVYAGSSVLMQNSKNDGLYL